MINPTFVSDGDPSVAKDDVASSTKSLEASNEAQGDGLQLKRRVGLLSGVALIVGNMIGSGIFVSSGDVLKRSGSVGLSLVIWAACGLLSILGSLAYAELGTLIPKSGGEYSYFLDGFRDLHPFWGPLPAFLFSWISVLLLRPSSTTIVCLSFAQYAISPLLSTLGICPDTSQFQLIVKLTGALCICVITFLNCYSVKWALKVQNTFTAVKLVAIAIIVGCGVYKMATGNTQYLALGFANSTTSFGEIATAFYGGLWSYDGWNNLNFVTEELQNPYVNLPRAIMLGIPLVTLCYLSVNIAYLAVLSPHQVTTSPAVAVDFGNIVLGPASFIIPLAVAMSTFGGATSGLFAAGRVCFVSAREGHLSDVLSYVHTERLSPTPALLFTALIALLMIIPGDISRLIDFFSFTIWIFYALSMVVLIVMRFTRKHQHRPYKVPIIVPVIVLVVAVYLIISPIISDPALDYLYVAIFILVGIIVYIPCVYYRKTPSFMGPFTRTMQLVLNVAPTKMSLE